MRRWSIKFGTLAGIVFLISCLYFRNLLYYGNARRTFIFLETSDSTSLTSRIACSIESTANHHPQDDVVYYSILPISSEDVYRTALRGVTNISFQHLNTTAVFDGTPLFHWHTSDQIRNSSFPTYHLSDAVRLAMLWKTGGVYLDSDMLILRPFNNFKNTLGYVYPGAGNNVLIFEQGHQFLIDCMLGYGADFQGDVYGHQGPELVSRVLQKTCGTKQLRSIVSKPELCQGVTLQPYMTFFTHIWIDWKNAFLKPKADYANSYAMHLYAKMSNNKTGTPGDGSLLDLTAMEHCPRTYQLMVLSNVL